MAINRMVIEGFGQFEPNLFTAPRTGRVVAQYKANTTDFAAVPVENGMILAVDGVLKEVRLPVANETLPLAVVYSSEKDYTGFASGLQNYNSTKDDFYPRLGYLIKGDKFTTNCVCYDTLEYADDEALIEALKLNETTRMYATQSLNGAILIAETKPATGLVLEVLKLHTMPDGQNGIQFGVLSDNQA